MNHDLILVKTDKGKEELESRRSLSLDLRHALILVDGHSTLKELLLKGAGLPLLADSLNILIRTGYANTLSDLSTPQAAAEQTPRKAVGNGSIKQQLILLAGSLLETQSVKIIKKIEDSVDSEEALLSTIESCGKVIRLVIDEGKAATFVVKAKDILAHSLK